MPLPKSLTTVTTFSRRLALILFILLPVLGFYLGTQYEKDLAPQAVTTDQVISPKAKQPVNKTSPTASLKKNRTDCTSYCAIKEWGIRFYTTDANKLSYAVENDSAEFYLNDSVTKIEECKSVGLGLSRSKAYGGEESIKLGEYYYRFAGSFAVCDGDPEGYQGSINQLKGKFFGQFHWPQLQNSLSLIP